MTSRSWRWLRVRILGLLSAPPAAYVWVEEDGGKRLMPVRPNRTQAAIYQD